MMIIERGNTKVCFCQETLAVTVVKDQTRWEWPDAEAAVILPAVTAREVPNPVTK